MSSKYRIKAPDSILPIQTLPDEKRTRSNDTLRPLYVKTSVIKQASGSAYIETGNLKLICSVYGPKQAHKSQLYCDFKFAPFSSTKRHEYIKDEREKEFGTIIQNAMAPSLHLAPKSAVDVFVYVLECDGISASLAAATTCASLALMDAGIELYDSVIGTSIGYAKDGATLLDCSEQEERSQSGSMYVAYMPNRNQVANIVEQGEIPCTVAVKSMDVCIDACLQIYTVLKKSIVEAM